MTRSTGEVLNDWLVLAGEAGAFEALARRWHRRLIAHAFRRVEHAEGAAEATQEAWLAIVRGLPTLDDPARFPGWAYRIVDRKAIDWLRRRRRQRALDDRIGRDPTLAEAAISPGPDARDRQADRDDLVDCLRLFLRELPAEQRSLLALYYTDGRSVGQIAEALDIPEGTVKSRLFHARRLLKAKLGDRS